MRKFIRIVLASVVALVPLLVLGTATASAEPLTADAGACWAPSDYQARIDGKEFVFQLVGEGFIFPSTTTRYWHVIDLRGFYRGGYVAHCDPNRNLTSVDLTRDHNNTGPEGLCEGTDFVDVEENNGWRNEHHYHLVGSRHGLALAGIHPIFGPFYDDFRYAYWVDIVSVVHTDPPFMTFLVRLSEAARCPSEQV